MAEEEQVAMELEALQAVYGDDCVVLDSYPPLLHIHIKPRTADVSSQLFVEAVIGIRAGPKESVEKLSSMNHPDSDCPLCLSPLFPNDGHKGTGFGVLISFVLAVSALLGGGIGSKMRKKPMLLCVHPNRDMRDQKDMHGAMDGNMGNCPVCRKVFHAKDIEHVLDLVGDQLYKLLLHSALENIRRQKFEAILKLQQENSGLIEPKRDLVVLPSMFLPQPAKLPTPNVIKETAEQEQREPPTREETNPSRTSNRPSSSKHWNSGSRKPRVRNPRNQVRQWIRKDNSAGD